MSSSINTGGGGEGGSDTWIRDALALTREPLPGTQTSEPLYRQGEAISGDKVHAVETPLAVADRIRQQLASLATTVPHEIEVGQLREADGRVAETLDLAREIITTAQEALATSKAERRIAGYSVETQIASGEAQLRCDRIKLDEVSSSIGSFSEQAELQHRIVDAHEAVLRRAFVNKDGNPLQEAQAVAEGVTIKDPKVAKRAFLELIRGDHGNVYSDLLTQLGVNRNERSALLDRKTTGGAVRNKILDRIVGDSRFPELFVNKGNDLAKKESELDTKVKDLKKDADLLSTKIAQQETSIDQLATTSEMAGIEDDEVEIGLDRLRRVMDELDTEAMGLENAEVLIQILRRSGISPEELKLITSDGPEFARRVRAVQRARAEGNQVIGLNDDDGEGKKALQAYDIWSRIASRIQSTVEEREGEDGNVYTVGEFGGQTATGEPLGPDTILRMLESHRQIFGNYGITIPALLQRVASESLRVLSALKEDAIRGTAIEIIDRIVKQRLGRRPLEIVDAARALTGEALQEAEKAKNKALEEAAENAARVLADAERAADRSRAKAREAAEKEAEEREAEARRIILTDSDLAIISVLEEALSSRAAAKDQAEAAKTRREELAWYKWGQKAEAKRELTRAEADVEGQKAIIRERIKGLSMQFKARLARAYPEAGFVLANGEFSTTIFDDAEKTTLFFEAVKQERERIQKQRERDAAQSALAEAQARLNATQGVSGQEYLHVNPLLPPIDPGATGDQEEQFPEALRAFSGDDQPQ